MQVALARSQGSFCRSGEGSRRIPWNSDLRTMAHCRVCLGRRVGRHRIYGGCTPFLALAKSWKSREERAYYDRKDPEYVITLTASAKVDQVASILTFCAGALCREQFTILCFLSTRLSCSNRPTAAARAAELSQSWEGVASPHLESQTGVYQHFQSVAPRTPKED